MSGRSSGFFLGLPWRDIRGTAVARDLPWYSSNPRNMYYCSIIYRSRGIYGFHQAAWATDHTDREYIWSALLKDLDPWYLPFFFSSSLRRTAVVAVREKRLQLKLGEWCFFFFWNMYRVHLVHSGAMFSIAFLRTVPFCWCRESVVKFSTVNDHHYLQQQYQVYDGSFCSQMILLKPSSAQKSGLFTVEEV